MRVMLLSLPGIEESDRNLFPLSIGYLAGAIKEHHHVEAYHFNNMKQARNDLPSKVDSFMPQIVGLSCTTFNRGFVKETIKMIKDLRPEVTVVVGGVHASFCSDQMLRQYMADVVVIGEGEHTFLELCNFLEERKPLKSVNGIAYLENGEVASTPPRAVVGNLDDLPMPDYSYAKPFIESAQMGFLITSRGCPVRCTFCSTSSFWGQNVRMNSVSRVVDEMEMLLSDFNIKRIFFHDDTFNLGISRVINICNEIINRKLEIEWACSCRVAPVSEEMIAGMVEAGCRHICWGVESGSEEILKTIDKKITLNQIRRAFELASKFSGLMSSGSFTMVGNPGESVKTVRETVDFMNTLPMTDSPSTSVLYVLPGTLLYEDLLKKGYIKSDHWFKYDTVPFYTVENSYRTLDRWAQMVHSSGKISGFDREKHFWHNNLDAADVAHDVKAYSFLKKIIRLTAKPKTMMSVCKSYLPAGKIRF